jgi:hypothetical protein
MTVAFTNKLVAVMNEKMEVGVVMNALAHMSIGLGAEIGKDLLRLTTYKDKDEGLHPYISEMPFMILKTNSNKIRALRKSCQNEGILFADFAHTMTQGTYLEQIERTGQTKEDDLIYYGIVILGDWEKVSALTRKFSLWK